VRFGIPFIHIQFTPKGKAFQEYSGVRLTGQDRCVHLLSAYSFDNLGQFLNALAKSRWHAEVNLDLFTGCGICEEDRCPMGAVNVVGNMATVDPNRCIGCGLCVTTCETEAIRMVPREQASEPPATISEMGFKIAAEKGRIDDFLRLSKR